MSTEPMVAQWRAKDEERFPKLKEIQPTRPSMSYR